MISFYTLFPTTCTIRPERQRRRPKITSLVLFRFEFHRAVIQKWEAAIENGIADLKKSLDGTDVEDVKKKTQSLIQVSMKLRSNIFNSVRIVVFLRLHEVL